MFDNSSILLTGGTGSFGHAFTRHMLSNFKIKRLVIFSRDELKQYEMAQEFSREAHPAIRYFIGDVRDPGRLKHAMRDIDYVVHAAAMKHIPASEYNPFECIKTNIMGAENVINASLDANVKKVVALSTDKAVNPINLYGASKLASDKLFVSANNMSPKMGTRFSVVRYGNVLGSRGSVVPFFAKKIKEGATSLPITDDRMTRFWITMPQAIQLVLDTLQQMQGGEVVVPKIPSMKMVDLALAMMPKAKIEIIGIRPGEKLHELMIPEEEARNTYDMGNHFVIQPSLHWWNKNSFLEQKKDAVNVAEDFEYRSDNNTQWLTSDQLQEFIAS